MAVITLSVGNISVSRTISDADRDRILAAGQVLLPSMTNTQRVQTVLDRLLDQVVAATKGHERTQAAIADIPRT